ncbi:hypothetical protein MFLAVUS_009797 [Mucor flavus]|uniref:N-acetyltransferase domain-containing protein n=1 Tax=Mucor flavus TaxID=439312 RepID=A0ABP9ZB16_9FUNG
MSLYRFSLQENSIQLQDLLVSSGPSTTSLLGWFIGTGFFELDSVTECDIWTSDPKPFQSADPVVWIFDNKEGTRVYVTSEAILDLGQFTTEAIELSRMEAYGEGTLPNYFTDSQLEILYNKSKAIFKPVMKEYKNMVKSEAIFFHGINQLWSSIVYKIWNVPSATPCFKFVKSSSSFDAEKTIVLPEDLKLTNLEKSDIEKVQSSNKIPYETRYIEDSIRISSAIRKVENNELVAWGMTHRNFLVGSLHVVPESRRKGYAEVILRDLCRQYKAFFESKFPNGTTKELYFSAAVEKPNVASASRFEKSGWTRFGLGNTWFLTSK